MFNYLLLGNASSLVQAAMTVSNFFAVMGSCLPNELFRRLNKILSL